ncbi:MAG: GntR family transcriptional regulator [Planctomycetota bacterium]|nr:GntR family transcriptional regulator [Planctomycetota bacterium]
MLKKIKAKIVEGEWKPGERLPTRRQLADQFGMGPHTVQAALDILQRDGFVTACGRLGTFVAQNPPHLRRLALAIPSPPDERWNKFWKVLAESARALSHNGECEYEIYAAADSNLLQHPDYQRFLADVLEDRLAGILFASPPFLVAGTPLLEKAGIPRAAIMTARQNGVIPVILESGYLDKAAAIIARQQRKRLAVLGVPGMCDNALEVAEAAKRHGLEFRPVWHQVGNQMCPEGAFSQAQMLALLPPACRPDSLFIADDNLAKPACQGLEEGGLVLGKDITVVTHWNFPGEDWPYPAARMGFDSFAILRQAAEALLGWRKGISPPAEIKIPLIIASGASGPGAMQTRSER